MPKAAEKKTLQFSEVRAMRDIIMRFNTLVPAKWNDNRQPPDPKHRPMPRPVPVSVPVPAPVLSLRRIIVIVLAAFSSPRR